MKYLEIIPIIIYAFVGIISMIMANKSLFSKRFILFHEKAAAITLDELDKPLQSVILALTRVSGLGFLVTSLLLLIFPIVNYFIHDEFLKFSIPIISLVFCTGLFLINYHLYIETKSETPWLNSLIAMFGIIIGVIISLFT